MYGIFIKAYIACEYMNIIGYSSKFLNSFEKFLIYLLAYTLPPLHINVVLYGLSHAQQLSAAVVKEELLQV